MYLRLIMNARFLYTLFDYNVLSEYMDKTLNITHRFSTESSGPLFENDSNQLYTQQWV